MTFKVNKGGLIAISLALLLFVVFITSLTVHNLDKHLPTSYSTAAVYKEQSLLDLINQVRAKGGKSALTEDTLLDQASQSRNQFMIDHKEWAHEGSTDGSHWYTIVEQFAPQRNDYGENLAACFVGNKAVVNGWVGSPEHYAIMMGDYTKIGFATTFSPGTITNTYSNPHQEITNCYLTTAEFSK